MALIHNALVTLTVAATQPVYGLKLHAELKARTGRVLNSGQIYTTLNRAEREGYILQQQTNAEGLALYTATAAGAQLAAEWLSTPESDFEEQVTQIRLLLSLPQTRLPDGVSKMRLLSNALEEAQQQYDAQLNLINAPDTSESNSAAAKLNQLGQRYTLAQLKTQLSWIQEALAASLTDPSWDIDHTRPKRGRTHKSAPAV